MKILTVLTYYRPHTSGLTIYAERLARAFKLRGAYDVVIEERPVKFGGQRAQRCISLLAHARDDALRIAQHLRA